MSKDIIYREDAINSIYKLKKTVIKHKDLSYRDGLFDALEAVQDLPSADRPQGEWIEMYRNGFGNMIYMCSKCNFQVQRSNFCPNCGARMVENR